MSPEARTETLNTKAAGIVGLAVMCSRVLGLAREQIFAALFGGGKLMDAFTIAFRIPNLLRDLFAEGALSTAFITIFSRTISREGDAAAFRLANKVLTLAMLTLSVLTILGIIFAPWVISVLAPGFDPAKQALTVTLARIMYPFILMVSLAALVMGMLNARNVFGIPAMASSFFNLGSIVAGVALGWLFDPHFGPRALLGLSLGTLVGGLLQLGVQLPALRREGFVFRPDLAWRDRGVAEVLRVMGPSVIAASSTQINVMVNSVFASHLGNGPTGWLSIAFRLMQLPLGIFGVALGTVSLPLLARLASAGNRNGFQRRAGTRYPPRLPHDHTGNRRVDRPGGTDHLGAVSAWTIHRRADARRGRCPAVVLRPGAGGLRIAEGARQRLLRHRPAQDAHVRELRRRRAESAVQLAVYLAPGMGPSRPGLLHCLHRLDEFHRAVHSDAPGTGAVSFRRAGFVDRAGRPGCCGDGRGMSCQHPLAAAGLGGDRVLAASAVAAGHHRGGDGRIRGVRHGVEGIGIDGDYRRVQAPPPGPEGGALRHRHGVTDSLPARYRLHNCTGAIVQARNRKAWWTAMDTAAAEAILHQQSAVPAIVARARGAATRLVGIARLPDFQAIVARRGARLQDCADLRQHRLGLPSARLHGGAPRADALRALTAALESRGLYYRDVDWVDLPSTEAAELDALHDGAVDAVYVRGPAGLEAARAAGARMLVDISGHGDPWFRARTALLRVVTVSERPLRAHTEVMPARMSLEDSALAALEMLKNFMARWAFIPADFTIAGWLDGEPARGAAPSLVG